MELDINKQFNVLVVDDNPKNIQVLGNILKESGYLLGFAMDGNQAITQLKNSGDYDLILLDIEMPELDGFETCKAIKADNRLKDIPVIFLTAYTDTSNIIKGFEAGAQDYITKPFNSTELLARVNTHILLKHKSDLIAKLNTALELKVEERTRELEKAYEELNNIDNLKTEFLVFISQQIRTPLDAVVSTLNLIKNQDHSTAIKQLIETLNESVVKLEDYTNKAFLFSQLSQKKYRIKITPLNIRELAQFALLEINSKVKEKQVEVDIQAIHNILFVNADRDLLFKALVYILENAIDYSPWKGKIEVNFSEDEKTVTCCIVDYGAGFSQDQLNMLTRPLQINYTRGSQNSGLSLYLVKLIMDLTEGKIIIKNKENAGAHVELVFNKQQ